MKAHHEKHSTNHDHREHAQEGTAAEEAHEPLSEVNELEKLTAAYEDLQGQLLRTIADMQNMRKRYQQEQAQLRLFATEDLVRDLLPALDNFERTIFAAEHGATFETVLEGIKAVDRQLRTSLERRNVSRIKAHGEPFDPDVHEAIVMEESEEHPEGTVTGEIEAGYKMADKVIRPARVKVSKKP